MTKGEFIDLLCRRLGAERGHVDGLVERLHAAGLVTPTKGSRRFPPDLPHDEAAAILLAVLAAKSLDGAPQAVRAYGDLRADSGTLADTLAWLFRGQGQPGTLIVRDGGATLTVDGAHIVFGKPAEDGSARFLTGATLAAIAAEMSGAKPADADAVAAISRIIK